MNPKTRTFLRVKRKKENDQVPLLQFSGRKRARLNCVTDLSEQLAMIDVERAPKSSLSWKYVETLELSQGTENIQGGVQSMKNKRSLNFIDATLDATDTKRQRLTLTLDQSPINVSSPRTKKSKKVILDPLTRLVEENLKKVQEGSMTLQDFVNFLEQDTRVRHNSKRYIGWKLSDGSNVLHVAALWNCVEQARYILLNYSNSVNIDETDSSGYRPYQIAKVAGNDQVAEVLIAFGADINEYVYDIYHISNEASEQDKKKDEATVVELMGGFGYLNELGEVIFETDYIEDFNDDSVEEKANDDDIDSNAEDHEKNDYPGEEDGSDEESDESSQDTWNMNFRHRSVSSAQDIHFNQHYYNDNIDGDYDSQYEFDSKENEDRNYVAYDAYLDE